MCDYGRLRYEFLNINRRDTHLVNGDKAPLSSALNAAAEIIKSSASIGVIASASESSESCAALFNLFNGITPSPHIDYRIDKAQLNADRSLKSGELLMTNDPYPNSAGADMAKLIPVTGGLTALEMLADPGQVDLLFVILDDKILEHDDLLKNLTHANKLIIASPFGSRWDSIASVSFALKAYTESSGSFTNIDGITQSFEPVMAPLGEAEDAAVIFKILRSKLC